MTGVTDLDLSDLDINLVFVNSPGNYLWSLNPGNVNEPTLLFEVNQLLPWYRLFKGEDLQSIAVLANNLTVRAALAARQRKITAAGDIDVLLGDFQILIDKAVPAATQVTLPNITQFIDGGYAGISPIWIVDYGNVADNFPITIVTPDGTLINKQANHIIGAAGVSIGIVPLNDKTGWYVQCTRS